MRYDQFKLTNDTLFELKMSPNRLAKQAAALDAKVGIEFEMVVPKITLEDNMISAPSVQVNTSAGIEEAIASIKDFFVTANSSGTLAVALGALNDDWREYVHLKNEEDESPNIPEFFADRSDMRSLYEWLTTEGDATRLRWPQTDREEDDMEIPTVSPMSAATDFFNNSNDSDTLRVMIGDVRALYSDWATANPNHRPVDFMQAQGFRTMRDIYNWSKNTARPLKWPTKRQREINPIEAIAESFGKAIGRPFNWSTRYHGADRKPGTYSIETDPSIRPDGRSNKEEFGIEIISPPLPLAEMHTEVAKVITWMDSVGAYTGVENRTGMHVNVSVPKWSGDDPGKLDYVKLVLMLGDNYVAETFKRYGNDYCQSAFDQIKSTIQVSPYKAARVIDNFSKINDGLNKIASRALHSGQTEHRDSINTHLYSGYVEFRSPGGDWMDDVTRIQDSINRMAVALDLAVDPTAERQEYLRKFGKLMSEVLQRDEISALFKKWHEDKVKIASMEMTGNEEDIAAERARLNKLVTQTLKKGWATRALDSQNLNWQLYDTTTGKVIATYRGMAKSQAHEVAQDKYGYTRDDKIGPNGEYALRPVQGGSRDNKSREELARNISNPGRNTFNSQNPNLYKFVNAETGEVLVQMPMSSIVIAHEAAREYARAYDCDIVVYDPSGAQRGQVDAPPRTNARLPQATTATGTPMWELYQYSTNRVLLRFHANTEDDAIGRAMEWTAEQGVDPSDFEVRAMQVNQP